MILNLNYRFSMSVSRTLNNMKVPHDILSQKSNNSKITTFKIYRNIIYQKRVFLKMKSFNHIDMNIKCLPLRTL